ncbi:hypothetical protein F5B20DRAFT_60305 [Whalleya microplaca]|nr:hypothetical protein F5B20DRAFT_60305 [Whalleya microplaca]
MGKRVCFLLGRTVRPTKLQGKFFGLLLSFPDFTSALMPGLAGRTLTSDLRFDELRGLLRAVSNNFKSLHSVSCKSDMFIPIRALRFMLLSWMRCGSY